MRFIEFLIFCLNLFFALGQAKEYGPVVTIPDGLLRGIVNQTTGKHVSYYAYRGIPFAKKPLGNLRFAAPEKNENWLGILDATQDKDACTQYTSSGDITGSEDCLYINVYTTNIKGHLPVLVWIYGGSFVAGSASYDSFAPDYIIEKGVVYVSFNYRLGIFGFLSTEDDVAPGNWGLKDQVLALKWVKNNIRYFGGDPDRVTLFGQSAGSVSVSYLVQSQLTKGLYKGAILESGTSLCLYGLSHFIKRNVFDVGNILGINTSVSQILVNKLRQVDNKALSTAEYKVTLAAFRTDNVLAGLPFGIVREPYHPGAIFSGKSHEMLNNGEFQKVPLIIGYNSHEALGLLQYINLLRADFSRYESDNSQLAPFDLTSNQLRKLQAGRDIKYYYFGRDLLGSSSDALNKFLSVHQFYRPIRETVRIMSHFIPVYCYKFSYQSQNEKSHSTYEGVGHAEEVNYLFAWRGLFTSQDNSTRDKFVTLWTNFAKTGNPTPFKNDAALSNLIWKPNTSKKNINKIIHYLNINATLTMESNPDQSDWKLYEGIYRRFGDPPYTTY